jgi:hypothetical protein
MREYDLELPPDVVRRLAELEKRKAAATLDENERLELDLLIQAKAILAQLRAKTQNPPNGASPAAATLRQTVRNGLPVIVAPPGTPSIDPQAVRRRLQEEGF